MIQYWLGPGAFALLRCTMTSQDEARYNGGGEEKENMKTVTVPIKGLNFAGCGREIEKRLGKLQPIQAVEASYVSQTATITYDETQMTEAQLSEQVQDCAFACGAPLSLGKRSTVTGPHATGAAHPGQIAPSSQMERHPDREHRPAVAEPAMAERGH